MTAAVAVIILVLALVFRVEIRKLVAWLVSFRRITKTADGYALEPGGEPKAALVEETTGDAKVKAAQESRPNEDTDPEESPAQWMHLLAEGQHDEAIAWLEAKIVQTKSEPDSVRLRSFKGHVLFEQDPEAGKRYFAELTRSHPENEDVHHWHGLSYYFVSLFDEAVSVFDAGLKRLPNSDKLIEAKADSLHRCGRDDQAIETIEQALAKGLSKPSLCLRLIEVLEEGDDLEAVEEAMVAGIRANPRSERIRDRYATFLWEQGRNEEAVAQFRELISMDRKTSRYWTMLGNAFLNLEHFDLALESYERADGLAQGREAWIVANIGNLYSGRGLHAKAAEYLRRAVELDPASEYAQDRLAKAISARGEAKKEAEAAEQEGWRRLNVAPGTGTVLGTPESQGEPD